jgi:hypothetical protein
VKDATQELLDIPGFIESFDRGQKDIAEGRVKIGEQFALMYSVVLSASAEEIYASADQALAKKVARCFEQLEQ